MLNKIIAILTAPFFALCLMLIGISPMLAGSLTGIALIYILTSKKEA